MRYTIKICQTLKASETKFGNKLFRLLAIRILKIRLREFEIGAVGAVYDGDNRVSTFYHRTSKGVIRIRERKEK